MAIKLKKTDFVRNLVKDHKLVNHLEKAIGQDEFAWKAEFGVKEADDAWHPSGQCVPSAYDLFQGVKSTGPHRPHPVSLRKSFQVGHFWHAYLQWLVVERLGFSTWDEVEVRGQRRWGDGPFRWAAGFADIAPCRIPAQGDFLVDIKTMQAHDYKQMGLPSWCAAKYECQVNVYMDWFDLERAILLCVQKDSPHGFKEFLFERNQPLIDSIYKKWALVGDCLAADEEPPEDYVVELPLRGPRL